MKKYLIRQIALLLCMIAALLRPGVCRGGEPLTEGPCLVVMDKELDLGKFSATTERYGQIRVRNAGDSPVVIKSVRGNCGCTVVKFEHDSIMPDSVATINIRFNGRNRVEGPFRKMIKIRSNSPHKIDIAYVVGTIVR